MTTTETIINNDTPKITILKKADNDKLEAFTPLEVDPPWTAQPRCVIYFFIISYKRDSVNPFMSIRLHNLYKSQFQWLQSVNHENEGQAARFYSNRHGR